ncbi:Guanylate-binding protein 1 [Camelus dromedarius]|uniref:Guanylate-binding protein 1 n=1 Tax=Camelus dromedarius TaxID=9838 RepID=A0A5N4DDK4_CAMDR|nr:Guanylate-binding protein 1 [Camelus dromedarius]
MEPCCLPCVITVLVEKKKKQKTWKCMAGKIALTILSAITQPVVVVAIVGLYRTGKSYLMNKLAGKSKGKLLPGLHGAVSHQGIWIGVCSPPEAKPHSSSADTEAPGVWRRVTTRMTPGSLPYNIAKQHVCIHSMGTINQQAMDQLHYVTELTDRIRAKSSPEEDGVEDSADFVSFFQTLCDTEGFSLDLETDGQCITPDEYLENSLKRRRACDAVISQSTSEKDKMFNLPRLCIRKFFPNKKCFIFDRPTQRKQLSRLEELRDVELDSEFVHQAALFCAYIFSNSKTKTLSGGIKVNGPRLETLVLTYVSAISSGDLPCMENAVLALAEIENSAAVQKAIAHYDQQMDQKAQLNKKRDDFCKQNLKESSDRCKALLKDIFTTLEEGVKQGVYSKPGGYRLFMEKIQELKKQYDQEPRKGIQWNLRKRKQHRLQQNAGGNANKESADDGTKRKESSGTREAADGEDGTTGGAAAERARENPPLNLR